MLAASSDQNAKTFGLMGAIYFAGEVFGADPDIDLAAAVKAEAPHMTPDSIKALLAECGAEMKGRGEQMKAAGKQLGAVPMLANPS